MNEVWKNIVVVVIVVAGEFFAYFIRKLLLSIF